jgi:hypothetical protein
MVTEPNGKFHFFNNSSYNYLEGGMLRAPLRRIVEVSQITLAENSSYTRYRNEMKGGEIGRAYFSESKTFLLYAIGLSEVGGVLALPHADELLGHLAVPKVVMFTPLFQIKDYIPIKRIMKKR